MLAVINKRVGAIKPTEITPFWHKRISEIIALTALAVIGVSLLSKYAPELVPGEVLPLGLIATAFASLAFGMGVVSYLSAGKKFASRLLAVTFVTISMSAAALVYETGGIGSPYIILWIIIGLAAARFGLIGLLAIAAISHMYLASLLIESQPIAGSTIVTFLFAAELPLILGFSLWYERTASKKDDSAYSVLMRELGQVANKSEIVINAIADGVIAVDSHGLIQLINPAAQSIIGWDKQDAVGLDYRSVLKITDEEGRQLNDNQDPIQQCLKTNQSVVNENYSIVTSSGKPLMSSILASPIGKFNKQTGAIIVFRDITTARQANREQAEFISTASHEMRTPVAAIEGYLGLALNPQTATIDEKARAYLTKAHESAQHLGRLFQDLLDVSQAEDGRLKNEPTIIDLVSFMRELSEDFRVSASQKGLEYVFAPDVKSSSSADQRVTPIFYTFADADHVREVVSNLIENAIKYTPRGKVTIDVTGDKERVRILVTDSGVGIPSEDISHIFQKFYRVDNTDTREIGGTGLGLFLARRLTEAMGGRLDAESEYGKGSTFFMELPRLSPEEAMRKVEQASENNQA